MWQDNEVVAHGDGIKCIHHPEAGPLDFEFFLFCRRRTARIGNDRLQSSIARGRRARAGAHSCESGVTEAPRPLVLSEILVDVRRRGTPFAPRRERGHSLAALLLDTQHEAVGHQGGPNPHAMLQRVVRAHHHRRTVLCRRSPRRARRSAGPHRLTEPIGSMSSMVAGIAPAVA